MNSELSTQIKFGSLVEYFTVKMYFFEYIQLRFSHVHVWFTDQCSEPLVIEDRINKIEEVTLVVN